MSDELRARATWLPPWGSCHGGAVTERAVPVRGIDCILQPLRQPLRHRVFVPVRGMSCVRADVLQPPTGQVTVPVRGIDCISLIVRQKSSHRVSVPVRGIDCILCYICTISTEKSFRPRKGHRLHRQNCTKISQPMG